MTSIRGGLPPGGSAWGGSICLQGGLRSASGRRGVRQTDPLPELEKRAVRILLECILVTVRKQSCRKVMFSQAYVKNSVHGGDMYTRRADRQIPSPGQTSRHPPGHTSPLPHQMATAAGGTHPTGMHTCDSYTFKQCSHVTKFSPKFSPIF